MNINVFSQNTFYKKEFDKEELANFFLREGASLKDDSNEFYKLKHKTDSADLGNYIYPILIEFNVDTLKLIEDLLKFQGDTSICVLPISCYDPKSSHIYMGQLKDYSIQVEALFIINQLYFNKSFSLYSPYPFVTNIETNKEASISGEIIDMAYEAYRQWYHKIKKIGLREARKQNIKPLDGYPLKWYYGLNIKL
ncbi:hypothetical protein MY04_0845 [Flammeovirga sp. MY04]|uniref:hypothetical protein n=1 Tax=Flammeovirga sp. MY04 TaxID=1191459 RepID=UPI0008060E11|nr:hypothetical protein [Flammeovirga sp. MY04]ANQ48227.1 hypothetical protein MY04_0845 [Flammeovirga sp. MY04]